MPQRELSLAKGSMSKGSMSKGSMSIGYIIMVVWGGGRGMG